MVEAINNSGFLKNDLYSTIVSIVCILVITYFISKLLNKPIKKFNKKNTKVILRLKNICVWAFAVYGIANQFNAFADIITAIAASTGVITLALSLAAQDAVSEFISGMMILSFKPFTVNDIIRITDYNIIGTVVDINIRHTLIRTIENTELIVPNSILNKAILENVSHTGEKKASFLELDISYDSDLEKAMNIIKEEIEKHPSFVDIRSDEEIAEGKEAVTIRLTAFLDSSMHLKTTIYTLDNATGVAMLSDLRIAIKKRFDQEGIVIPYPHTTVEIIKE